VSSIDNGTDNGGLWEHFAADAAESLRLLEQSLLALEGDRSSAEHVNSLYRGLHTIKGNSAFLELSSIERVAHAAEDLVGLVRDRGVTFDDEMAELLYAALDALQSSIRDAQINRRDAPFEPLAPLVEAVRRAFEAREMQAGGPLPASEPALTSGFVLFDDEEPAAVAAAPPEELAPVSSADAAPMSGRGGDTKTKSDERSVEFLRVDAGKITALMDLANELGLACSAVTHHDEVALLKLPGFAAAAHKLELLVREIQTDLSSLRLVSVSPMFQRMRRVVRDVSRRTGKQVSLVLQGEETEIDKVMIDALQDPLVHILRNAIDHGIETPAERLAAGKPEGGVVTISALQQGGEVTIEVKDDGRGLDHDAILARARERGLCASGDLVTEAEIASFVMMPGFSTKQTVDALSGRGVGMDVVKTTVEGLRGRVAIRSTRGLGSLIQLTLPLTLAFVEALVVRKDDRLFALPIEKVVEVSKLDGARVLPSSASGRTLIRVQGHCVPVLWLHRYWNERNTGAEHLEGRIVVVVQTTRGPLALPVDQIIGNQQVMLKPMRGLLAGIRAAVGCGMLRTGDVAVALDCEQLAAA